MHQGKSTWAAAGLWSTQVFAMVEPAVAALKLGWVAATGDGRAMGLLHLSKLLQLVENESAAQQDVLSLSWNIYGVSRSIIYRWAH